MKEEDYDRTLMCVFWDPTLDEGFGNWSSTGCRLNTEVDDKAFCECDHLTSFALLMVCIHEICTIWSSHDYCNHDIVCQLS